MEMTDFNLTEVRSKKNEPKREKMDTAESILGQKSGICHQLIIKCIYMEILIECSSTYCMFVTFPLVSWVRCGT